MTLFFKRRRGKNRADRRHRQNTMQVKMQVKMPINRAVDGFVSLFRFQRPGVRIPPGGPSKKGTTFVVPFLLRSAGEEAEAPPLLPQAKVQLFAENKTMAAHGICPVKSRVQDPSGRANDRQVSSDACRSLPFHYSLSTFHSFSICRSLESNK